MSQSRLTHAFAAVTLAAVAAVPSLAGASDRDFFDNTAGVWQGPGQIVAGTYKGTRFTCDLRGESNADGSTGLSLDGDCYVGVFKQEMSATIRRKGSTYKGKFLVGTKGDGLDITSGDVNGDKVIVGINHKKLNGAMVAHLMGHNKLNVTISVRHNGALVPVIGMTLNRKMDQASVGSVK